MKLTEAQIRRIARQTFIDTYGSRTRGIGGGGVSEAWVQDNFVSIEFFSKLFNAYNGTTLVSPNDTESTITNIKAMFGFWTEQYISALGKNDDGGSGGVSALSDLVDVSLSSPANGQALVYNATTGKWVNGTAASGTVTQIATGTGLTGGPITGSGTISIDSTYLSYISHGETAYGWGNHANQGYLTGISSSMITNALGYTPLSKNTSFWGQTESGGVVSGSMTSVGGISMSGSINGCRSIELNNGSSPATTDGGFIDFHYDGTNLNSDYTARLIEESYGVLSVSSNNSNATYQFKIPNGIRIGDGMLTWDSANNALKVSRYDGTTAHLYSLGGISALGMFSDGGPGSIDAFTIATLTVSTALKMGANTRIAQDSGNLYLGMATGGTYVMVSNLCSDQGSAYWNISRSGSAYFTDHVQTPKLYLDSSRYIYLDSGTLKYYNGTASQTIVLS